MPQFRFRLRDNRWHTKTRSCVILLRYAPCQTAETFIRLSVVTFSRYIVSLRSTSEYEKVIVRYGATGAQRLPKIDTRPLTWVLNGRPKVVGGWPLPNSCLPGSKLASGHLFAVASPAKTSVLCRFNKSASVASLRWFAICDDNDLPTYTWQPADPDDGHHCTRSADGGRFHSGYARIAAKKA